MRTGTSTVVSHDTHLQTRIERWSSSEGRSRSWGLPEDLLRDAARRLRVIAIIYAGAFAVGELFWTLSDPLARAEFRHFTGWGPGAISVGVAVLVAILATRPWMKPAALMNLGLGFEVVGAYGIAFSTYWGVYRGLEHQPEHLTIFGLSFVAPWIMFFTIVAPSRPWRAFVAAALAATAVPVTLLLSIEYGGTSIELTPAFVVSGLLVPYSLVVVTAWLGARVVFKLGAAVTRARQMGSYLLTEPLGEGGMGEVWKATHRMLARPAAIKLIRPDRLGAGDPRSQVALRRRFEREAQATALMHSPHTIDVYDFGVTADGTFYYVMELLEGFDLQTLVHRFGPLPPERTVYLLRQVCDSLGEAHQSGLIHRDVKPANVYLCRQGRPVDCIKVLDFGLVKLWKQPGPRDLELTGEHELRGTPAFMAPEQICGGSVDARTDIYAVGCLAYWLLTGQLVFQGKTVLETMTHHLQTTPAAPSRLSEAAIPDGLDRIVLSCLDKDPLRRPQTADQLDVALAALETDSKWTPHQARRWWDQHRPTAALRRSVQSELSAHA